MAFSKIAAENLGGSTLPALAAGNLTGISTGKIKQIVHDIKSSDAKTTSTSFVTTGLFLAITPTSASNKILVHIYSTSMWLSGGGNLHGSLYRGTSGEGSGSSILRTVQGLNSLSGNFYLNTSIHHVDSPNSTDAQTYTLMQKSADGTSTGWHESGMGGISNLNIQLIEFAP